jgi:hypothetical protein
LATLAVLCALPAQAQRAADADLRILRIVLDSLLTERVPDTVVVESAGDEPGPMFARAMRPGSPIDPEWPRDRQAAARKILSALSEQPVARALLRELFATRVRVVLTPDELPPPSIEEARERRTFVARYRAYGISYSSDGELAAVVVIQWCGPLCGYGRYYVFERAGRAEWRLLRWHERWVS